MTGMRVLIVEDQVTLADDIADGLRDQGMAADVAYDGASGLEKALLNRYDVVVLDRDLPKVHGDAICAALAGASSEARILMLTASGTVGDRVEGLNLGADDYLVSRSRSPNWWRGCARWAGAARPPRRSWSRTTSSSTGPGAG